MNLEAKNEIMTQQFLKVLLGRFEIRGCLAISMHHEEKINMKMRS